METDKLMVAISNQDIAKTGQVPTEWKPCVSGDEEAFTKALNHQPINKSTVDELKQVLKMAMLKVGMRANNLPDEVEKAVLIEHIMTNYGNHTPMEIKLAFDMAISGKLGLEDKEVVAYENFSCLYFSKILNAYRKWASETYTQLKVETPTMIEEKKHLTDDEWEEWLVDMKGYEVDVLPVSAYDYLLRVGKINPSTEDKKYYMGLASLRYCALLQDNLRKWDEFVKQKNENKISEEHNSNIVVIAKRMLISKYLKDV